MCAITKSALKNVDVVIRLHAGQFAAKLLRTISQSMEKVQRLYGSGHEMTDNHQ